MRGLFISIVLTALVGCSDGKTNDPIKHKGLARPSRPVADTTRNEELPREGESVTKLDSGAEYRGPANPQNPNPPAIKLKSGNEIKVLAAGKIHLATGKPGWMFQYRTGLRIDDVRALQEEAEEIWPIIRKDVEKGGYNFAILSANESPKQNWAGFISNNRGYNFVFEKTESGEWKLVENKKKEKAQESKRPLEGR
jgi:hypothetical protein